MITLTFLGAPRTSTKSLWAILSEHKEISTSINKEPFNVSINKDIFPKKYLDEFNITENTKILLDGTPCAYCFFRDKVNKINIRKKIIYPVRNPFDRMYSNLKEMILTQNFNGNNMHFFIKDRLKIHKEKIIYYIPFMFDSKYLHYAFKITDDVLITRWDKMNLNDFFTFMEIEPIELILPKLNSLDDIWNKPICAEVKSDLDSVFKNQKKEIAKLVLEDLKKIQHKVYVEDWIDETKNILSNV